MDLSGRSTTTTTTTAVAATGSVAGVYQLSAPSVESAFAGIVEEFVSATGSIVIGEDGTVSGLFTYVVRDRLDISGSGVSDTSQPATIGADVSLTAAVGSDGVTFESTVPVLWNIQADGQDPFTAESLSR